MEWNYNDTSHNKMMGESPTDRSQKDANDEEPQFNPTRKANAYSPSSSLPGNPEPTTTINSSGSLVMFEEVESKLSQLLLQPSQSRSQLVDSVITELEQFLGQNHDFALESLSNFRQLLSKYNPNYDDNNNNNNNNNKNSSADEVIRLLRSLLEDIDEQVTSSSSLCNSINNQQ